MSCLAIKGGPKVRYQNFPAHITTGIEEKEAVVSVLSSGILSNYLGARHENFMGGKFVRKFEETCCSFWGVDHALAVNSNTSGLISALGAIELKPLDEVLVVSYSMTISATAPLFWGAIPIFVDVEQDYYCMDANKIEQLITEKTRAILVVNLFGQVYDYQKINAIAKKHDLYVIEDSAQAPFAKTPDGLAGTLGDIGVFSLNYHKHIHSGEGGIIVTKDALLAEKCALIRNHAEAVDDGKFGNLIGYNFRMTEIEAAIAEQQLHKLTSLMEERLENVVYFEEQFSEFEFLQMPKKRSHCDHCYYGHPIKLKTKDINNKTFAEAVRAELSPFDLREKEGVKIGGGYVPPIYRLPLFKESGKPKTLASQTLSLSWQNFESCLCPVTESLHDKELLTHEFIVPSMSKNDILDVKAAFEKVWSNRKEL